MHSSILPLGLAWEAFEEKNGADSIAGLIALIAPLKGVGGITWGDLIGCIILRDVFFLPRDQWIPVPRDFHRNIVVGKTYDTSASPGRELWQAVQLRLVNVGASIVSEPVGPTYGGQVLVRRRVGQGTFRVMVTDMYERRCALTREKALPVLQAAHIRPVSAGGTHRLDNGLLLRSDVHALFDRGYVTVTPDHRFHVSRRLKDDFDNGEHYFQFQGTQLWLPPLGDQRPAREFLEWHADTVFRG